MFGRPFGRRRSPWREVKRLQREMNRLFATVPTDLNTAPCFPAINVWTNEDGAVVTTELAGFAPQDIEISVVESALTLAGNRKPDVVQEGETWHRRERLCKKFTRSVELPFVVEVGKVEAVFEKGVLSISLPRAEADKPKKIEIKAG